MRLPTPGDSRAFMHRLREIFDVLDAAYEGAAALHGFRCSGCEDNCCRSRFHHHTLLECLYLRDGLAALPEEALPALMARAADACRRDADPDTGGGGAPRLMCPLNLAGRCLAYAHRPMICRLHGIPHELRRPGGGVLYGPGCDAFARTWGGKPHAPLDRTPHYRRLAALEGELRQALGFEGRIRMTVARILLEVGTAPAPGKGRPQTGGEE